MSKPVHKIAHFGPLEIHFMANPDGSVDRLYVSGWTNSEQMCKGIGHLLDNLNVTWCQALSVADKITYYDECDNPECKEAA